MDGHGGPGVYCTWMRARLRSLHHLPLVALVVLSFAPSAAAQAPASLDDIRAGRPWIPATSTLTTVDGAPAVEDVIAFPFVTDSVVPGEWVVVAVVADTYAFRPQEQIWQENLYDLVDARFDGQGGVTLTLADGKRADTWTNGHVFHDGALRTDSPYTVSSLGRELYMFLQWKTEDYSRRFQRPAFYVLRKL